MRFDDFIRFVGHRTDLDSRAEARRTARVTLEVLAERLESDAVRALKSQLPSELARSLRESDGEPFAPDEFIRRVSHRDGVRKVEAEQRVRAVLGLLRDALEPHVFEMIWDGLPREYQDLARGDREYV